MSNRVLVTRPAGQPHRYGLRSVADLTLETGVARWVNGIEYDTDCGTNVKRAYVPCDPTVPEDFEKEPADFATLSVEDALVLYAMAQCDQFSKADTDTRVMAELAAGEDRALEAEFALRELADATDVLAGGTNNARAAVGHLLQAWPSGVEPTIHMSPLVATMLGSSIQRNGNGLYLRTGEKVSVGYGYATGAGLDNTDVGAGVLFATGPVFGYYSQAIAAQAPILVDNQHVSLVERIWLLSHSCDTLKVTLDPLFT